jgi:NAD(P)-dependent dehydrogenase (short-subunit alcohol dehydrogenase family)
MGRLDNKVIAIAGGASGIGAGVVRRLVHEGASVAIGDMDFPTATALATKLSQEGARVLAVDLNIDEEDSVAAFVAATEQHFGGLDAFHANAANFSHGNADTDPVEMKMEVYDDVMRTNARGFFLCTRHAIPALLRRGGGSMVYTSSGAAHAPDKVRPAYSMSKAAVHALMRHVAMRWGADHIRANVIAPGVIMTPKLETVFVGALRDWAERRLALKTRLGRAEDIGAMVAHLVSDDGAFISGQVISVDGGSSMRP